MYPGDPIRQAQHIRLMNELKDLYVQGVIQADLKKAILARFTRIMNALLPATRKPAAAPANYFANKRIAVYTAIFGPVDEIHEPLTLADNCDYFIFTDQALPADSSWQSIYFRAGDYDLAEDPVLKSRFVKMFPDKFFPGYDFTLYLDGKFQLRTDPTELIQTMDPLGLKMFHHPLRACVYDEIQACLRQHKGNPAELMAYRQFLQQQGMPHQYGLLEGAVILRETGNSRCQAIMNQWWEHFRQKVRRDQLSLPFILWQNGITIEQVGQLGNQIWSNPIFRKYPHRKNKR